MQVPPVPRLLAPMIVVMAPLALWAADDTVSRVGVVSRIEKRAQIVAANEAIEAEAGRTVDAEDELRTEADARLQVTFKDGSKLTLGADASVVVERYAYDAEKRRRIAALNASRGAIRFEAKRLDDLEQNRVMVTTPVATIKVRGTDFWAGPIDGKFGVLLLAGKVVVSNSGGTVTLSTPGDGTNIDSASEAPSPASAWDEEKVGRALEAVAFQGAGR